MKFRWLDYGSLRAAAGAAGAEGTGGDNKDDKIPPSDKVKIGGKEYDPNTAASAVTLYEALQDPNTGQEIIETLARRAGLIGKDDKPTPGTTPREAQTKLESLSTKVLKAKLGKDYEKFADSVGPAFDDIIKEYLDQRFGEARAENTQKDWSTSVDHFMTTYTMTPEIENKMQELISDSGPNFQSKTFNAQKYLTRVYKNAIEELDIEMPEQKVPKGTRRSSNQDEAELPEFVVREAPKDITIDMAVDAALRGIKFKHKE